MSECKGPTCSCQMVMRFYYHQDPGAFGRPIKDTPITREQLAEITRTSYGPDSATPSQGYVPEEMMGNPEATPVD